MISTSHLPHKIAFLAFDNVQLLDLVGPLECFDLVKQSHSPAYETFIIAPTNSVKSESGIQIVADFTFEQVPDFDTLVIPGGIGARQHDIQEQVTPWIKAQFSDINRLICICTGIFFIADFPQLKGMSVTTHWDYAEQLQSQYPQLIVDSERLFIQNDNFYSSAGVLSGIDLALHIIERDHGSAAASSAAQYLVTYLKRSGHQSQFSDPLKFQSIENDKLKRAHQWLVDNLHKANSVSELAAASCLSERHFNRLVHKHFKMTAKSWMDHVRLEQAKLYLSAANSSVKQVSFKVGYRSADSFGRAFKRKYGVEPGHWQQYFSYPTH